MIIPGKPEFISLLTFIFACWDEVFGINRDLLHTLAQVNLVLPVTG